MPPDRLVSLLRHGETLGGERFRGTRDDPLTELGRRQVRTAARSLLGRDPAPDRILCSPTRRCLEPARDIAQTLGLTEIPLVIFAERGFGTWEGLAADRIPNEDLSRFWDDPTGYTPPGAEPFGTFRDRVLSGFRESIEETGGHTLMITHGGVIRVLLAEALGLRDASGIRIEVPHACLTRLRVPVPPGGISLMSHGPVQGTTTAESEGDR